MKTLSQYITESNKKDIFTLDVFNVSQEEGLDDFKYTSKTYYSEEQAINAARKCAKTYKDEADVITVTVMGGEYETENGNTYGEPYDIYTVSNKDKETTIKIRNKKGYTKGEVDEYIA